MTAPARFVVVLPLIAGLVGLAAWSGRLGSADTLAYEVTDQIVHWHAARTVPSQDEWLRAQGELETARRRARNDAAVEELLGVVHADRRGNPDFQEIAASHFVRAIALRPSSPYTWVNLAEVRYRLGQTGGDFERILTTAEALGPNEPQVQRVVADLGLALWPQLSAAAQAAVTRTIASGMRRNPMEMLRISARRGRLDIACPYLPDGARLPDPLWAKLCEKTT